MKSLRPLFSAWIYLRDEIFNDVAMDIRQSIVPPLKSERQFFVIKPKQMHDGRLQVMNVDRVVNHVIAKRISLAVTHASSNSATGHPK